jgi:acyl-CoA synthetase (AMP-forming)/AMP-acid ligase II
MWHRRGPEPEDRPARTATTLEVHARMPLFRLRGGPLAFRPMDPDAHLTAYQTPWIWQTVEEFPQTASGKIQKFVLGERYLATVGG